MVKSPNGYPVQSPYIAIANRQAEIMLRIASEFGFTPASRSQRGWMTASHPDLRLERSLSARRLEVCPPQVSAFTGGFEAGLASRRLKGFQPSRAHLNTLIAAAGPDITARVGDISLVIQD